MLVLDIEFLTKGVWFVSVAESGSGGTAKSSNIGWQQSGFWYVN